MELINETEEYIKKKRRKYWRITPKNMKGDKTIKYVAIDPCTYKIVNIFNGICEIEFATNRKNLQPLMLKHINNQFSKTGSPLLCNLIFAKFNQEDIENLSIEEIQSSVLEKTIEKIIIQQLQRIRENIDSFTKNDKIKIHKFLNNVESPNPNDINIKIKL